MTISITKKQLIAFDPCDLEQRLEVFGDRDAMNVSEALEAGFSVSNILWVAGRLDLKMQCVDFSIRCAKRVAHLNTDPRVRAAIDAAEAWLKNPSEENRLATAAADAAWAADAAAWAADAAAWAADAAAWAAAARADAAAWAARAAAARAAARADAAAWAARAAAARAAARAARAARAAAENRSAEIECQKRDLIDIFG